MLINSASIYEHDTIASLDAEHWQRQMRVNALAPILLAKRFHERAARPASIINMLDQKVTRVTPDFFSYTLSKLALFNATRMLAMAFGPKSRVNAIAPGLTLRSGDQTREEFERTHDKTPLGVGPTPEDICRAASLIADTPSMTGQVITIDGGRHLEVNDPAGDLPKE
jgi:NAD(P)-dependent dehydrogenase (short-subunit alcohol dehydrogenase family)